MILRGVRCPLNWARAKVRLEELPAGARLALVVDDVRAVRDIPRAAEAHGYAVLEVEDLGDGWRIEIER
jgi:sulfite reductase (ferredoxin)